MIKTKLVAFGQIVFHLFKTFSLISVLHSHRKPESLYSFILLIKA